MDLVKLQRTIGLPFKDIDLLKEALTHKSFAAENGVAYDNQRLEFLGDAVVQIVLTQHLFRLYPKCQEGELTKMRSAIAKEESLAALARKIGLGEHILLGRGEKDAGGSDRDSTLSDAFESLVGAIYLDAGMDFVQNYLLKLIVKMYPQPSTLLADLNPKGSLQEYTQQHLGATPEYKTVGVSGPDHSPSYTVEVLIKGRPLAHGSAPKRKAAESAAAKAALDLFHAQGAEDGKTEKEGVDG
jgi:ribonuclease-3